MPESPDVIFLGPSLRHSEARELHPDAVLLPPAAVGDMISAAARFRPHAIALIDGAFLQNLATYHKEILDVLAQGIWVVGASSMGALRAAECAPYGMIGIGDVFQGYVSGRIEDDDEVALTHLAADYDFRPVTEAMVNIRATLAAAAEAGVLSPAEADLLVAMQKERWFMDRRPLQSVDDARDALAFDESRARQLREFLVDQWVDVKGNDARLAIAALRDLPAGPIPIDDRPLEVPSGVYGRMKEHDLTVGAQEGLPVTRDQIWRQFALSDPRARAVMERARLRAAVADFMTDLGVVATEADRERARASIARDLGVSCDALAESAAGYDIDDRQLARWITEEALVLKALLWRQYERMSVGALDSCLQQLVRMGEYDNMKRSAGLVESVAAASAHSHTSLGLTTALKLQSTISSNPLPTDPDELDDFISFVGLGNRAELYERLSTMIAAHRELFDLPPIEFVSADEELDHDVDLQTSRGR